MNLILQHSTTIYYKKLKSNASVTAYYYFYLKHFRFIQYTLRKIVRTKFDSQFIFIYIQYNSLKNSGDFNQPQEFLKKCKY